MTMHPMHGLYAAHLARQQAAQHRERVTSMCLEIADWTHEDCAGDWCCCPCHAETQEAGQP